MKPLLQKSPKCKIIPIWSNRVATLFRFVTFERSNNLLMKRTFPL